MVTPPSGMHAAEIMTQDVHAVASDVDGESAWHHMRRAGVRHLVVLGPEDVVVGILSSRDLGAANPAELAQRTVRELMTGQPLIASPETEVRTIAKLMREHVIGCLPIVDGARLVGIVTTSDLLGLLAGDAPPAARPDHIAHGGRILRR